MIKKLIHKLCQIRNFLIDRDDFNWKRYHKNYSNQIKGNEKIGTLKLSNDFKITDGELKFYCKLPLDKNHELLYQVIYDLNPESIFEVGCGCGDHMYNLKKILPGANIRGCDLLQKQLDYLDERNPELRGLTSIRDITNEQVLESELVFTQAVVMHIQKDNRHINALFNLINSSTQYVVLMENWSRHKFYSDIKKISLELKEDLFIYKVDSGKQILMVVSKVPIKDKKLKYVELKSDEEMLKYLK